MKLKSPSAPLLQSGELKRNSRLCKRGAEGGLALAVFLTLSLIPEAQADESVWHSSWDGTLYGYIDNMKVRGDSLPNPGNLIARLAQNSSTAETRFNLKAESSNLSLTMRPVLLTRESQNIFGRGRTNEGYLSQWQLGLHASEDSSLAAGREILNWGPGQFRSPSSPFYFDNGRSNPMLEISGMDDVKFSWTPDLQRTVTLARITGSGHIPQDIWSNSWLLKADRRSDDWSGGLILEQTPGQGAFLGTHGQLTASDAVLIYAEASSSTRANALLSVPGPPLPFGITPRSARRTEVLAGAAYTFQNGQSLNAELMYYGHGFTREEEGAYFSRAALNPAFAGQALAYAPPLLGRDYLHLVWQSNLMDTGGYWRIMLTHGYTDSGNELSGYGEIALSGHVTAFVLGVVPAGNARQEFSAIYTRALTAGLKVALP